MGPPTCRLLPNATKPSQGTSSAQKFLELIPKVPQHNFQLRYIGSPYHGNHTSGGALYICPTQSFKMEARHPNEDSAYLTEPQKERLNQWPQHSGLSSHRPLPMIASLQRFKNTLLLHYKSVTRNSHHFHSN